MITDIIGVCAGVLTTIAFLPQVLQVIRTRSTHDISLAMYSVFTLGIVIWLVYGFMLGAWPIIIANVVTLVLALIVLVLKLKYG